MGSLFATPTMQVFDSNGDPGVGYLLYSYEPGTTTEKDLYTDRLCTVAETNPVVFDSRGEAEIYGLGLYKLVLKTDAEVTLWTVDNVAGIGGGAELAYIGDYSDNLSTAITAIGGTSTTLYINAATSVSGNVTVPANVKIEILKPGTIDQEAYTLTINGPFTAPPETVFLGTGTISFTAVKEVFADWFGSSRDDAAISTMSTSLGTSNKYSVTFSNDSDWDIDDDLDLSDNKNLQFIIPNGTIFSVAGTKTLTFHCPEQIAASKNSQIFSGAGTVAFDTPGEVYAEWWGALGDGSTDDSTAIQAAIDVCAACDGGIVKLLNKKYVANLTTYSYVTIEGFTSGLTPSTALGVDVYNKTTLKAAATGVLVDTPVTEQTSPVIRNIHFEGLGDAVALVGIHLDYVGWGLIEYCTFDNFADQAILHDEGSATQIKSCMAWNCLLDRSRAGKSGVFEITGDTVRIDQCEVSASMTADGAVSSGSLYICGLYIKGVTTPSIHVSNSFFEDCDVGVRCEGVWCHFDNVRSDWNMAHGWEVTGPGNYFANCYGIRNSKDTTNTYDAFIVSGASAVRNSFINCEAGYLPADGWVHRYGFNDSTEGVTSTTSDKNKYFNCISVGHGTAAYYIDTDGPYGPLIHFGEGAAWYVTGNDATPSVAQGKFFEIYYDAATNVTFFDDGMEGQQICIISRNTNPTIKHNASYIVTTTGSDVVMVANTPYHFIKFRGVWYGY